jgi:hypothetical protein
MAALILPNRWLLQPQGPVEIDWSHPLAQGLVFFSLPTQKGATELVGGAGPTILGASIQNVGREGIGIYASNTSGDGWVVPYRSDLFRSITTDCTVATQVDLRSITANSKVVCAPFYDEAWSLPNQSLSIARSGTTSQVGVYIGTSLGGAVQSAVFPTNTFVVGADRKYVISRSGSSATMLYNGTSYTPSSSNLTTSPLAWNTGNYVALLNRSRGLPAEGTMGMLFYAAVWNRSLSTYEQREFQQAPYQMLKPTARRLYFEAPAAGAPSITATSSATLPKLSGGADAVADVPAFLGASAASLSRFGAGADGITTVPGFAATVTGSLPALGGSANASHTPPERSATSAATLPALGGSAEADRTIPDRTATGTASLPMLGAGAAAVRLPPPVTAESVATLPLTRLLASGTALAPVFAGDSASVLARFGGIAEAQAFAPGFTGESTATLPGFGSRGAIFYYGPDAADLTVAENIVVRVRRTETVTARTITTIPILAKMRAPT